MGRERELEAIAAARAERGCRGVVIVAEPGVGKSRLAREALAAAERDGALVAWAQATRSAAAVPLAAVADLVPDEVRSDDIVALMRSSGAQLRARAGGRAVVVGVDDAQLLDPASAALVLHLATSSSAFIVATVRAEAPCPDAVVALWKDDAARRLELGPLTDDAVRALVEAALGGPVEEAAIDWVTEVGRGNALYVRELVRGAVDAGALVRSPGLWRMHGRPAASPSLVDLVAAQLDGLTADERRPVELLALGEPLAVREIAALTSSQGLLAAESRGLLAMTGDQVGLAHPLYGEAVGARMGTLAARGLRLELVHVLEAREPFGPDEALRAARLRLDAGAPLSAELALVAARAANGAGDAELGAQLAQLAGVDTDLEAAILLAQAQSMRNRHEEAEGVLAAVEHLAPGHPQARRYLRQRLTLYQWGLRRTADLEPLIERAADWSDDDLWPRFMDRMRATFGGGDGGFGAPEDHVLTDDPVSDEGRRSVLTMHTMASFLAGEGDATAEAAFRARPPIPLRDQADSDLLAALSLVALEAGYRWVEFEEYMGHVVRAAVRMHDHGSAGVAAFALARLHFVRGHLRDADRWRAEAELHFERQDPYGVMVHVRVLEVGLASFTGDFDATMVALERMRAWCAGHEPLPVQRVPVARAEGWALRLRSPGEAGRRLLQDAVALEDMVGVAPLLAYDALRVGAAAAPLLERMAARGRSRLVTAYARHATAKAAGDAPGLVEAAEEMAAIGALRYAVEAASDAATVFVADGRHDCARRAAARARALHPPDQGGELPVIDGLDATAVDLTPREAQLVGLASQGLSNAEIGDRLVLSVRTVETHLYRGMQKLGVRDRRDL
ncbi:MAG TPA: LuxR C-terminal-related transcriptional regulator [Solirubrobacteraceae bacterium]|nr:LuxR C-terminal-related transcriptional regulator [Solirubrobacteraceae bacterium]